MEILKPKNEAARLKALKQYNIWHSGQEREFDRLTEMASIIFEVPMSTISIIGDDIQWLKSAVGLDTDDIKREQSICTVTILEDRLLEINDTLTDKRFNNLDCVVEDPNIRFYAGYPIIDKNGYALGSMCVLDNKPNKLTEVQRKILKLLAEEAAALIQERKVRENTKNFEKIFNSSDDLICIANTEGFFERINPGFIKVLGYDEQTLLNKQYFEFIHPDDITSTKKILDELSKGKSINNFINRFKTIENDIRYIEWLANPDSSSNIIYAIGRDITDSILAQKKVEESETKLSLFFENSQGLMCTHDLEGNFLTLNQAGAAILGYKTEELIGKNLSYIIPEKYHDELQQYLVQINKYGKASGNMVTQHKNGSVKIWMFNNVVENSNGQNKYVIGNSIDITERYHLERDLVKTKSFLEQTNQLARVGGWEVDLIKNTVYWTDITKEIHEVPSDFVPDLEKGLSFYEEGPDRDAMIKAVEDGIKHNRNWDIESKITTAKGNKIWVRAIGHPVIENGKCVKLKGAFQDVDQRKKAELEYLSTQKLLSDVLDSTSEVCIIATDTNGIITLFNKGAERMLGYEAEEVLGIQSPIIIHNLKEVERRSNYLSKKYNKNIDGFETFIYEAEELGYDQNEWTYIAKDKKEFKVSLVVTPIKDIEQKTIGYLGVGMDISEAYKIRLELMRAKELAEDASKAKSEFLANMSHEIRTPLNGIIGFTELVLKTNLTETQNQYLQIVNQSANSLLGIINDILDFSKIEAGKLELDIDKCDVFEIGSQCVDIISFQAQSKNIEVLLNIEPQVPRYIWADNIRLKQILVNLLSNAVKFTTDGEVELSIKCVANEKNRAKFEFKVRDTGIGIHPSKQEKIFEAFAQEDSSTTKKYGGTGLGLSISNKLLYLMNSKLELSSEPGKGSVFYFSIELQCEEGERLQWEKIENIKKVLVVDDHDRNREILKQMLLLQNIQTIEAKNGIDAIHMLSNGTKCDLVIMDFNMPYLDGLETIKKIRENLYPDPVQLPIILFHSSSEDAQIADASEILKINRRINKPIKIDELFKTIARVNEQNTDNKKYTEQVETIHSESPNILIAEDNNVNILLTRILITKAIPNVNLYEASTGIEAIEICKNHNIDLIFMDIQMPDMNGYKATEVIRKELKQEMPILALTAGVVKDEVDKCIEAGMNEFISKPVSEINIINALNKWVVFKDEILKNNIDNSTGNILFDKNTLKQYLGDDEELLKELMLTIQSDLIESLKIIEQIAKEENVDKFNALIHKLLGMSKSSGLIQLANYLTECDKKSKFTKVNADVLNIIKREVKLALSRIENELNI